MNYRIISVAFICEPLITIWCEQTRTTCLPVDVPAAMREKQQDAALPDNDVTSKRFTKHPSHAKQQVEPAQ